MIETNLRAFRKSLGMKQNKFAEENGIAPTTYNGYETGQREPSISLFINLASKYGVSVDYLIGLTDDPKSTRYSDDFYITLEEKNLVKAWRQADEKERRIIAATLEEYGFEHQEKNTDSVGVS